MNCPHSFIYSSLTVGPSVSFVKPSAAMLAASNVTALKYRKALGTGLCCAWRLE